MDIQHFHPCPHQKGFNAQPVFSPPVQIIWELNGPLPSDTYLDIMTSEG